MTIAQFEAAFLLHYKPIFGFCYTCLRNVHEAEDTVMHAFLSLYERLDSIRYETAENYLVISARNKVIDIQRREKAFKRLEIDIDEIVHVDTRWEDKQHLIKSIDCLPEKMKEGIMLQYIHGYSREEVAAITKKSPNTVRNNIAAGLAKLRQLSTI